MTQPPVEKHRVLPILSGRFHLHTEDPCLQQKWYELLDSIPERYKQSDLPEFCSNWHFTREDDSSWRLTDNDQLDLTTPDADLDGLVAFLEYIACGEVMLHGRREDLPVHAALVSPSPEAGAIAIAGLTTAGKSTTSVALWEAGWQLISDDRCFITGHDSPAPEVIPVPRRISLRTGGLEMLKPETKAQILDAACTTALINPADGKAWRYNFRPSLIRAEPENPSLNLRAMVFLDPETDNPAEPANPAKLIRSFIGCTAIREEQNRADTLHPWFTLAESVPIFTLGRQSPDRMKEEFFSLNQTL